MFKSKNCIFIKKKKKKKIYTFKHNLSHNNYTYISDSLENRIVLCIILSYLICSIELWMGFMNDRKHLQIHSEICTNYVVVQSLF